MPKALSAEQFRTLERLTDLIIPADDGKPGAVQAQVPAWIDTLLNVNAELKARYRHRPRVARHDDRRTRREVVRDRDAGAADRAARQHRVQEESDAGARAGADFFVLARRMTVDGFYTSADRHARHLSGQHAADEFTMPQEAIDYVVSRSPLK